MVVAHQLCDRPVIRKNSVPEEFGPNSEGDEDAADTDGRGVLHNEDPAKVQAGILIYIYAGNGQLIHVLKTPSAAWAVHHRWSLGVLHAIPGRRRD